MGCPVGREHRAAPRFCGCGTGSRAGRACCCSSLVVASIPLLTDDGYVNVVVFDTLIFCLLALGLNVVVGWGGLLDLGYIAFFGVGAYTYAILSSEKFDLHLSSLVVMAIVVVARRAARVARRAAVVATLGRLPRHRHAVRLPDLHQHRDERPRPVRRRPDGRRQRDREPRSVRPLRQRDPRRASRGSSTRTTSTSPSGSSSPCSWRSIS